jgi:hypothetical protein
VAKKNDNLTGQGFHTNPERINKKGAPKKLPDIRVLVANILGEEKDGKTAAEAILMKLRQMAAQGNLKAAEMLLNRGYGLPKQTVELSGNPDAPINFVLDERYKNDPGIST